MLTLHTYDEFKLIALKRLRQEGIEDEELYNPLYIMNAVLKGLRRRSLKNAIRIARKSKTLQDDDDTILTLKNWSLATLDINLCYKKKLVTNFMARIESQYYVYGTLPYSLRVLQVRL